MQPMHWADGITGTAGVERTHARILAWHGLAWGPHAWRHAPYLLANQSPQLVDVDDGAVVLVLHEMVVPHADLEQGTGASQARSCENSRLPTQPSRRAERRKSPMLRTFPKYPG